MRDKYVDIAKGISMLLVVRIHTEFMSELHVPYPVVAVPLFFFLSGFYDRTERPVRQWIKKDFCILIGTSFIWSVITFVYVTCLRCIRDGCIKDVSLPITWDAPILGCGATWFLVALFWAKLLSHFLSVTKLNNTMKIVTLVIIGTLVSQINIPFRIDEGFSALTFYYFGKMAYHHIGKLLSYKLLIFGGAISILFMTNSWFPYELVNLSPGFSFWYYPLYLCMTLMSFSSILWFCKRIENWECLSKYGQQTLGILVLHPIMLHTIAVILKRIFEPMSNMYIICSIVGYVVVCIGAYYISLYISKHLPFMFGRFKSIEVHK